MRVCSIDLLMEINVLLIVALYSVISFLGA